MISQLQSEMFKKYQEQLSGFAVEDDVEMTVLTDGTTWWFSLPLFEGSIEETRFQALEINGQRADDVTNIFNDFLQCPVTVQPYRSNLGKPDN